MYARHLGANLAIVRKQTHDDRPDRLHECSSFLFDLMSSVYIIRGIIHVCGIKCCFLAYKKPVPPKGTSITRGSTLIARAPALAAYFCRKRRRAFVAKWFRLCSFAARVSATPRPLFAFFQRRHVFGLPNDKICFYYSMPGRIVNLSAGKRRRARQRPVQSLHKSSLAGRLTPKRSRFSPVPRPKAG